MGFFDSIVFDVIRLIIGIILLVGLIRFLYVVPDHLADIKEILKKQDNSQNNA